MSPLTLKIGPRSPRCVHMIALPQWCIHVRLIRTHQLVQEMECRHAFLNILISPATLKIRSRSPKSNHFFPRPNNVSVQVWSKSIHWFTICRVQTKLIFTVLIAYESISPKSNQIVWLSQWYSTYGLVWIHGLVQEIGCRLFWSKVLTFKVLTKVTKI